MALAYPLPPLVFHDPLERPVRLTGSPDWWLTDRLPGRLSDSQIAGKHPSVIDRQSLSRKPAGAPRRGKTEPKIGCRKFYISVMLMMEVSVFGEI